MDSTCYSELVSGAKLGYHLITRDIPWSRFDLENGMGRSPQFNRRFPTEHHDLIARIIDRLRVDPAFADGAEDLLSRPTTEITTPLQERRDAVLEEIHRAGRDYLREFARIRAELKQQTGDAPGQQAGPPIEKLQVGSDQHCGGPPAKGRYFIVTPGGNKQMTDEGEAEIERQLRLGIHQIAVAKFIGVGTKCIRTRRQKLDAEQGQNTKKVED
jgi:hypothetical protein